jgi:membrane-associated phospholipid phosphatase
VKAIVKANLSFLLPYAVFLLLGAVLIFINSKADTHLLFNTFHNFFFDKFFAYMTYMGEGVVVTLVFIMLLAIKYRYALILAGANIISALITQVLKHTLFDDVVRPKKFFEGIHDLYLVPGIDNHEYFSFPSGHTTSAFSLYFALALIVEKRSYKLLFFILALLIGFSRIYLSQHFFEDVYAGSIVGATTAFFVFYFVQQNKRPGLEKSIVTFFS